MMSDARFTRPDTEVATGSGKDYVLDEADIASGDVQIVDIEGYTLRHLAYISIFVLRIYMKFLQEAYPSRLKAMHVINCPSFLDRLVSMMSPFLREEVRNMVRVTSFQGDTYIPGDTFFSIYPHRSSTTRRAWRACTRRCPGTCCRMSTAARRAPCSS